MTESRQEKLDKLKEMVYQKRMNQLRRERMEEIRQSTQVDSTGQPENKKKPSN